MRNQLLGALIVGTALSFSPAAMAEPPKHGDDGKRWEEIKNMTPEEREKFHAERKAKWDALSTKEKVKMIEERRAQKRKEMDERWNAMSDEEKIRHVEERMKQKHKRHMPSGHGEGVRDKTRTHGEGLPSPVPEEM